MVAKPILLVSVLLVASATTCCLAQQTYYVKPDPNTPCETDLPCHTLDHYVANGTFYFRSNMTLVFLPGRFHLSQEVFISDLEGFALLGSTQYNNTSGMPTGVPEPSTEIYCTGTGSGAFGFYNITNLYISNLVFTYCGYVGLSQVSFTPIPALYFYVRDLSVVGVVVQNSTKYGMLLYNTAGNVTIYGSKFVFNSGTEQYQWSNLGIVVDQDVSSCTEKDRDLNLTIQSSQILFGSNGSGLFLGLYSPCHNNMVAITDVHFNGNGAPSVSGGNMYMETNMGVNTLNTIHIEGCYFADGEALFGGGLVLLFNEEESKKGESTATNTSNIVIISNTQFVSNQALMAGGGVAVVLDPSRHHASIHIKNVTFDSNICLSSKSKGGAMCLQSISMSHSLVVEDSYISDGAAGYGGGIALFYFRSQNAMAMISNTTIVDNRANKHGGGLYILFTELSPDIPQQMNHTLSCCDGVIHINNVTFERSTCLSPVGFGFGGAVVMFSNGSIGTFLLIEDSYVSGGVAGNGGGIALQYVGSQNVQAVVVISNTTIVDNRANKHGGGIFISFIDLSPDIPQQMYHTLPCCDGVIHINNVTFERNTCSSPEDEFGFGGAVAMIGNSSISTFLLIEDSYIADGAARGGGGIAAVYYSNVQAVAVISNTIIEHNVASQIGGGIYCRIYSGTNVHMYIRNATTISNSAGHLGGGIHIDSDSDWNIFSERTFNMNISHTLIVNNTARMGGGLSLCICNTREIDIVRTTFIRNHAVGNWTGTGGNIFITDCVASAAGTITLKDCNIQHGTAERGAGIAYVIIKPLSSIPILSTCQLQKEEMLYVSRTYFLDNVSRYSADISISIDMNQNAQGSVKIVRFEQCTLNHSSSYNSAVVSVYGSVDPLPETYSKFEFLFEDTVFHGESGSAIVQLWSLRKITFCNCSFTDNNATAIVASSSNIFLEGSLLFKNNVGYNGGAVALFYNSMLFLYPNTHIQFIGNSAMHAGGAIYVDQVPSLMTISNPCFYQIKLSNTSVRFIDEKQLEMYNISIDLVNNTATAAGSALYGGSVDNCTVYSSNYVSEANYNSSTYFNKLFSITAPSSDYSPISSDPIGVCFCHDNKPDCENETLTNSTYPGALVAISAVVVGQRNGVVRDGIAIATYNGSDFTGKTFSSSSLCQYIELRVYSLPGSVNITLRPGGKENFQYFTRQLQVSVLPCPLGFSELQVGTEKQYACDCNTFLKGYTIRCTIDDQTFQRPPNVWIGTSCTNLSTTDVCRVMVHDHCPFQYCKPQQTEVTLNDTDSQCNLNHSGILCGGCRPGYSLVLGTSRCLRCSNKFSSLLFFFVAAGLALVFLLMLCNMTVSDGTINGLIFYVNIVGINSATFFPTGQGNLFTSFLSVFIAWINLDLGIETCFYDRMDMYQKTWLQFVFPLYIWAIVLFLITATHYSTLASKMLVRRNAVKVLATLFLLSFAKLLRTTIAALSFIILKYSDGNNKAVWLYDGNMDYLTGKHIPLFVVALLVFVLLMLPYTVVLTFSQCIQRKSNHQLLSWYTKLQLQPLFDAYAGPYKDRFRFWSGLQVIVRIVLFLVFALNALGNPNINLLAITIVSMLLVVGTGNLAVYKKWTLTVLETFILANLCTLSTSTHYVRSSGGSQVAVTGTLVGLVFASFTATLSYRAYQELQKTKLGVCVRNTCMQIPHLPAGWRHIRADQYQQDETGEADGQPVPRRALVQHWEIALGDPECGEATLLPISSGTHPQSTQSHSPHDTSASARGREYSAEMYRRHYCSPESPTPPLSPSHHNDTSDDPLQPGVAHLDTDPAPNDPHPSDTTTSDHTGTDSHSNTTLYRAQVLAFIGSTSHDNPEYENYNEMQTIQRHSGEDNLHPSHPDTTDYTEEVPSYSSSSDYRDQQIFEILAFDSSSHDHSQFEPKNSNPVQVIHHDEDGDSDISADEHQSLLKN